MDVSTSEIVTVAIDLNTLPATNYFVKSTEYYCVYMMAHEGVEYEAVVEFRKPYKGLVAAVHFYGRMTIAYAIIAACWGFFYWQHRSNVLAVQNSITTVMVLLIIEMCMNWLFYDFQNRNGTNAGSKALMIVVAVLNAERNSFSFFLLLIVCMGYAVVKPSLGKTMIYVCSLTAAHFIFGLIYAIAFLTITSDHAGPIVLSTILPLARVMTAFCGGCSTTSNSPSKTSTSASKLSRMACIASSGTPSCSAASSSSPPHSSSTSSPLLVSSGRVDGLSWMAG